MNLFLRKTPAAGTLCLALLLLASPRVDAAPRAGEALVAAKAGSAEARVFVGPVHEGRTKTVKLFDGAALGENARIITGRDGHLCVVLTPGAILCVAPGTELTLSQLQHTSDGLPRSEEDIVRRIGLELHKGRVLVHAGVPSPSLEIRLQTAAGRVEANGGTFIVAGGDQGRWHVFSDKFEVAAVSNAGRRQTIAEGQAATMNGEDVRMDDGLADSPLRTFEVCQALFQHLEPFFHHLQGFDRQGLAQFIGLSGDPVFLGTPGLVADVSPSYRSPPARIGQFTATPQAGAPDGGRWTEARIWAWWESLGPVRGVNYIPRTAVNSTEMWMKDTFDEETMDEELSWAHRIGYTDVRVQLQFVVWQSDPEGLLERVERFLELADKHGLRVVPVLFDDLNLAANDPAAGPQPGPVPGQHNSRWTPSPGPSRVTDPAAWPELERYLKAVIGEFRRDQRVLYWDLYNTAGNDGLWDKSLPLMDQAINWARSQKPGQPIAIPAWREFGSAMAARKLERSDLVTFHSFEDPKTVEAQLLLLKRYNRPIFCTDWLMRQRDNTFEKLLPIFSTHRVGWFNRGLVQGKTQTWLQQPQHRTDRPADLWQHDILKPDGEAYDAREIELIQGFRYHQSN